MKNKYRRHGDFEFRPKSAALLVIDMQKYFTDKASHAFIPSAPKLISKINMLASTFYKNNRPVVYTRHIDKDHNNLMCRWWSGRIDKDDPMSEMSDKLNINIGTIVVIKHQYDAFLETGLEKFLRDQKATQVVITGVATHLCCETTARSAFMKNFETFFVVDGTATYDVKHHNASIFNLAHGFAVPMKTAEVLGGF